jgi:hypothetical protein
MFLRHTIQRRKSGTYKYYKSDTKEVLKQLNWGANILLIIFTFFSLSPRVKVGFKNSQETSSK